MPVYLLLLAALLPLLGSLVAKFSPQTLPLKMCPSR